MLKEILNSEEDKGIKSPILLCFFVLNLIFIFQQFHLFIGNHDWDWIKGTDKVLSLNTGMFEGRYAKFILNVLLFGGQVLPILNMSLAFLILVVGLFFLMKYWQINNKNFQILLVLYACLSPFILGWLYFPINILGNFSLVLCVSLGLILSQSKKIGYNLISIILFLLALGVYPSAAEMMIICLCFAKLLKDNFSTKEFIRSFVCVIISLLTFKLILYVLESKNLLYVEQYNIQQADIKLLFSRIFELPILIFKQLCVTLPFIPATLKILEGLIVILAFICSIIKKEHKIEVIALWVLILFSTVLSAFIVSDISEALYMPRINFYGLNFLYLGSLAILLKEKGALKNIGYLLGCICLFCFIKQDIEAEKVWELGKTSEEKLIERISERINQNNTSNKVLTPIVAGEISLRQKYYNNKFSLNSPYILEKSFMVRHIPSGIFNFYAPEKMFYTLSVISNISKEMYEFLATANLPWPHINSLYVDDNYAIILLTSDGITAIKLQLPK